MAGLVDIHTHLLPGIDDGPETLEESLEMACAAVDAGITLIAATPHVGHSAFPNVRVEEIGERSAALQQAVDDEQIPLQIVSGAETTLVWALEASDEELRLATYGQRGNDLLVETPHDVSMLEQLLYRVRTRGFRVTLGHPERSMKCDAERLQALARQGILLQVNADALLGPRSSGPRRTAEQLCREGLASAVASDGHRGEAWRPVSALRDAAASLETLVGPARARWMASEAPQAIINGIPLPDPPEVEATPKGLWRLLSGR